MGLVAAGCGYDSCSRPPYASSTTQIGTGRLPPCTFAACGDDEVGSNGAGDSSDTADTRDSGGPTNGEDSGSGADAGDSGGAVDTDPCLSQCPLNVDHSNCVEQPLESFPELDVTLEEWSETMCDGEPTEGFPFLLEARCADGTRLLYYGSGLSIERRYYTSSGEFIALETGSDGGQGPRCNSSAYWPVRVECDNAIAANVVCGTATFMVGDSVPL